MYHFVYLSFEEFVGGRDYVGVHSTDDLDDGYLGSFTDGTFEPTARIILQFCRTRAGAVESEGRWQKLLNVVEDPKYVNRAYQTSEKFDTSGCHWWHNGKGEHLLSPISPGEGWTKGQSFEERQRKSERISGEKHPQYGRKQTPESNLKRSESLRGPRNHNYGRPRDRKVCEKISITKSGVATGSTWWVNPDLNLETHSKECPGEGWVPGRLKRKWWINSEGKTKHSVKSPGPGWKEGRK